MIFFVDFLFLFALSGRFLSYCSFVCYDFHFFVDFFAFCFVFLFVKREIKGTGKGRV